MKAINLTSLKEIDEQYEKITEKLNERFKCDWDDSIHESYGKLVVQLREMSKDVKKIRCKVETLQKEVEELKIDDLMCKADALCREADAV
jgi:chaperonin cofactor prefoldin